MATGAYPPQAAGRAGALIEGWAAGLPGYAPEDVERMTGLEAARVERLARQFGEARPSVAMVGGAPLAHSNGLFTALAVNALNALVGAPDQAGGVSFTPQLDVAAAAQVSSPAQPPGAAIEGLAAEGLSGGASPQIVFVDGTNPVFTTPPAWRVREWLEQAPYIVSFGQFLDETSILADLILPDHSSLEAWTEALPESGAQAAVVSVAPPAMRPLHQTRATPDVLLEVGRVLGRPLEMPWQTFDELLAASLAGLPPVSGSGALSDAQRTGVWSGTLPAALAVAEVADASPAPAPVAFAAPEFDGDAEEYPFHFLPYSSNAFLDGSLAHLPWLQEMPDPLTSAMWSSWIEINPATAERLGISAGDLVEVASAHGTLRTGAVVSPGIAPDLVAMPAGQGHRRFTRYASGRGESPVDLLAPVTDSETGVLAWAATWVRITRVGPPDGRLILFAGALREHAEVHR
jgi:anaerobic selenocysteine-containing dehydrogenase